MEFFPDYLFCPQAPSGVTVQVVLECNVSSASDSPWQVTVTFSGSVSCTKTEALDVQSCVPFMADATVGICCPINEAPDPMICCPTDLDVAITE